MTENPYQSPGEDDRPADGFVIGLRWYHLPFIIALACGLALAVIFQITFANERHFAGCVAICVAILLIDVPVCGLLLWE